MNEPRMPQPGHYSRPVVVRGATVLDCTGQEPHLADVLLQSGMIVLVGKVPRQRRDREVIQIDGEGCTLMPGLIDAHVHLGSIGVDGDHGTAEWSSYVIGVTKAIEDALDEGFTTVRDAGGLEPSFARAVRRREIRGPRILPSASQLTSTGGHGDSRPPYSTVPPLPSIPGLFAANEIVDGPEAMVRMAREQLRRGATQVKVFASGGVVSLGRADPERALASVEFSTAEMAAAVGVAIDQGTYVMAHCQTPDSVRRAIDAGVRSIEHGVLLDEESARRIADASAFLVPTLSIYEHVADQVPPERLTAVRKRYAESVAIAQAAHVLLGSGSDSWGAQHPSRANEIALKAKIIGNHNAILSATAVNSQLLGLSDKLGTVEAGKLADLILVEGNPIDDVSILGHRSNLAAIIQHGRLEKLGPDRLSTMFGPTVAS
jgi:imidazolonepropionase-like amidohydrolase